MSPGLARWLALTGTAAVALFLPLASIAQHPARPTEQGTAFLGRVVDATTGQPIAGEAVTLTTTQLIADGAGRFLFRDLAKGRYAIRATAPGYLPSAYGQRRPGGASQSLVLEEAQRVGDVTIRLWKEARLSGTVADEAGDPIVDVTVSLLKREADGRPAKIELFDTTFVAQTDDPPELAGSRNDVWAAWHTAPGQERRHVQRRHGRPRTVFARTDGRERMVDQVHCRVRQGRR
jgi:hypothetical protein